MPQADPTPGSYVVTVKGVLPNRTHFAKLAMYSFQPDGAMREDFWVWYHNQPYWYGNTSRLIGRLAQPAPPGDLDHDRFVQGPLASGDGDLI